MNHYDTYKPSGIDWIGDVPSHWEVTKLKHVLSGIQDGTHGTFKSVEVSDYLLLSAKNVFEDGLHFADNERHISKEDYESIVANGFPQLGDIAMCCVGTIGRCYIYDNPTPLAFQRSVTFLRINNKNSNRFILYALKSDIAFSQYSILAKTTAQSGLYMGALASVDISLPPLSEQEAIAAYLDKRCGEIDKVITTQERRIELLREMKQSIITHAVTKGINPNAPMKDSGVEWIGEVPEHWEVKKMKMVCKVNGRVGYRGYTTNDLVLEGEGAYTIGGKHISRNVIDLSDPEFISWAKYYESPEIMVKKGDILTAQRGTLGRVALVRDEIGEATINPSLVLINNITIENEYFYWYYVSNCTQNCIALLNTSTAVPMISQNQIENMPIPEPPLVEQQSIVAYIEKKTKALDAAITKAQREVELLRELKQATITEVVTGKRKVC